MVPAVGGQHILQRREALCFYSSSSSSSSISSSSSNANVQQQHTIKLQRMLEGAPQAILWAT